MNNLFFPLIFSILFPLTSYAQINFSNSYDILNHNENLGFICSNRQGEFLVFGSGIDQISGDDITASEYIFIIDNKGEIITQKKLHLTIGSLINNFNVFSDTFHFFGVSPISNNHIIWYKSTLEGDSIQLKKIFDAGEKIDPIAVCFNDELIFVASKMEQGSKFTSFDHNGNKMVEKDFNYFIKPGQETNIILHDTYFSDIDIFQDSFLIMSLYYWETGKRRAAVYKADMEGNVIWSKTFEASDPANSFNLRKVESLVLKDGSGFIVKTIRDIKEELPPLPPKPYRYPSVLYKSDPDGNLLWEHTFHVFPSPDRSTIFRIKEAANGDIIGAGGFIRSKLDPRVVGWIFRMSPDGQLLWNRHYYDERLMGSCHFFDIEETEDGSLIAVGNINNVINYVHNNSENSWVLKLDKNGCYYPGCSEMDTLQVISDREWCPTGAKWTYGTEIQTIPLSYGYEELSCDKDTLITYKLNGMSEEKSAKLIKRKYVNKYQQVDLADVIIAHEGSQVSQFFNDEFHLLFDFDVQPGDTLVLDMWESWFGDDQEIPGGVRNGVFALLIDSIKFVQYNGESLKEYYCSIACFEDQLDPDPATLTVTQNIVLNEQFFAKDSYWLFNTFACRSEDDFRVIKHSLRCYEDLYLGHLQFEEYPCDTLLSVNDPQKRENIQLELYPNPVYNQLQIKIPEGTSWRNWIILNVSGQILDTGIVFAELKEYTVTTADLSSGIYLIRLEDNEGRMISGRFVKL